MSPTMSIGRSCCRLAAGSLPAAALLLAVMAFLPVNTVALAHWIRMGLVVALPFSGFAIVLYPFVTRTSPRNDKGDVPPRTLPTVLFGVVLGLLVTLTSVGAGAIGVTVLAALYPMLPAKRLVGSDIAHAVPLTLLGGLGHLGLGNVDAGLLLALLCGSIPGILLGARLAGVVPERLLRPILARSRSATRPTRCSINDGRAAVILDVRIWAPSRAGSSAAYSFCAGKLARETRSQIVRYG